MVFRAWSVVGGAAVAVIVAAAVAAVYLLLRPPLSSGSRAQGPPALVPAPATTEPVPAITAPPVVGPFMPAHGAYIGAYVQPAVYTVPAKIAAMKTLQAEVGGRLDIVHSYLRWDVPFPKPDQQAILDQGSIPLVSWAGGDTRVIASGADDAWIRRQALAMRAEHKPIFLEWRWEMNRLALQWQVHSPSDYVAAWDHIRSIFTRAHVKNVAWVWCPSINDFAANGPAYYPGNSEVDWLCGDAYPPSDRYTPFTTLAQPFLDWASRIGKPVMIGEYGAPRSYGPQARAVWLLDVARMARADPQIKALVYFDGDPPGIALGGRYGLNPGSAPMQAFRQIANEAYFDPGHLRAHGRPG